MSHLSPLSPLSSTSPAVRSSSGLSSDHFLVEGEFQGFASGKKSPFKYLLVKTGTEEVRIKLKKSLRMMLFRYLVPGDWVRVVGKQTWEGDRDEMVLKADEVVRIPIPSIPTDATVCSKLSPKSSPKASSKSSPKSSSKSSPKASSKTVSKTEGKNSKSQKDSAKTPKAKSAKILLCQKSSCRKRGGVAVGEMVERSLSELGLSDQVSVKYTGCMDRCKAGPNVVFMPGKAKYKRVEPGDVPDLVRHHCGSD